MLSKEQEKQRVKEQEIRKATPSASSHHCKKCGAACEAGDCFCPECGDRLAKASHTHCPYCGVDVGSEDVFCSECGNPLAGIACPQCNTISAFNFCLKCNTPLTVIGTQERSKALKEPVYKEILQLSEELKSLLVKIDGGKNTCDTDTAAMIAQLKKKIQQHKEFLAQRKQDAPMHPQQQEEQQSVETAAVSGMGDMGASVAFKEKCLKEAQEKLARMEALFKEMAVPEFPNIQAAQTYYAARKPAHVNFVFECRYKHLIHPSEQDCKNPLLGGRWIPYIGDIEWEYGIE